MGYRIRISNTGRVFEAEEQETVLDAALRSGVRLPYNCSNGTCGECKARIDEGRVARVDFHDYSLSDAEKAQNYALLCSVHPGSDLVVTVDEAVNSEDLPWQTLTARVWRQDAVGGDFRVLQLRTPRTKTLRFLAGQYVTLRLPGGESAAKAIASCPCNGRFLQFHLYGCSSGFDHAVWHGLAIGDPVTVEGPAGGFTLDEEAGRPVIMVAEGTGFGPIKSIIEQAIAIEKTEPLRLFRVADRADGFYLSNHCRSWTEALDDYVYTPLVVEQDDAVADAVLERIDEVSAYDLYIAAGERLTRLLSAALIDAGVDRERIWIYPDGRSAV